MGTLIGYAAAPLQPEALFPWAASFWQVCPQGRVILLADPAAGYQKLTDYYGIEVRQVNLHTDPFDVPEEPGEKFRGCVSVYKDRWAAVSEIEDIADDEKVLLTDTRDVLFQRDPFVDIKEKITVATEGVTYRTDFWNRMLLDKFYPELRTEMMDFPTICAGVVGGPWKLVKQLASAVRQECGEKSGLIDQVSLNVCLRRDPSLWEALPYTRGWTCHCAQMIAPWVPDRAKIYPRLEEGPLLQKSGHLTTRAGKTFAIVHHWPMVPALKHFAEVQ